MNRPIYLTESEFATVRDIAANRAAALGISEKMAMSMLLTIIRQQSPLMLDNMGLCPGTRRIIDALVANAQWISGDCASTGTGGGE